MKKPASNPTRRTPAAKKPSAKEPPAKSTRKATGGEGQTENGGADCMMTICIWCGKPAPTKDNKELHTRGWRESSPPDSLRSDLEYFEDWDWYCTACIVKCTDAQLAERFGRFKGRPLPRYYLKSLCVGISRKSSRDNALN